MDTSGPLYQPPDDMEGKLRDECVKLLKDEAVNWSMIVMIASMRLTALSHMVLKRTLDQEQASSGAYDFIVDSARAKARSGTDLKELMTVLNDFVPPFIQEEMSRNESAEKTERLMEAARRGRKSACKVSVMSQSGTISSGEMLLLMGTSEKVSNAIDELLGVPQSYCFEDGEETVPREEIVYFNHRCSADHGCRVEPLQSWSCSAVDKRTWNKSWVELPQQFGHLVISNINMAGRFPPPPHRTTASQVKQAISTISRSIMGSSMRVIAGAFVPAPEPAYTEELIKYAAGRKNVTIWKLE